MDFLYATLDLHLVVRDSAAETNKFDKHTIDCLVTSYATSIVQVLPRTGLCGTALL